MITVKYISGVNEKVFVLNENFDISIKECNPHASSWTYEEVKQRLGTKITSFGKDALELEIIFKFRGDNIALKNNQNNFFEECETDIVNLTPGELWFNEQYLTGWFISHETVPSAEYYGYEQTALFLAPYPFYIQNLIRNFYPDGMGGGDAKEGLDYEYDYEYDYSGDESGDENWFVNHFTDNEFEMIIYGPCENPKILIGGYPYEVYDSIEKNEYIIINSRNNTVIKYRSNGTTVNIYDLRAKEESIFKKIPSGNVSVNWSGAFGFTIKLFLERGEPIWN